MTEIGNAMKSKSVLVASALNLGVVALLTSYAPIREIPALLLAAVLLAMIVELVVVLLFRATARLKRIERATHRIDERTRLIRDTAGSVGRMAPLVRAIEGRTRPEPQSVPNSGLATPKGKGATKSVERGGATATVTFPAYEVREGTHDQRLPLRVAVILDEFSERAFAPEWHQLAVTPSNWRSVLEDGRPDLLFVESAWNGNGGAWLYHLVGDSAPRPALVEMVAAFRQADVPTVFWNKEDPPHFEDFLKTAGLFDHVYTSDANMVPRYQDRLGHGRVDVLPFAAQPRLHNPSRPGRIHRDREVAFGGMYFRHKYPERRAQMDFLLPAAAKFKFDIFSRQAGGDENYQFPKRFQDHVRGSLSYDQMLTAYHAYKVFLNVNSVTDSPTMCARRVFEILASGAAVVTAPSLGIKSLFDDRHISIVDNQDSAYHEVRSLLRSPLHRDRMVHRAQREIWSKHTYRHRVQRVAEGVGLLSSPPSADAISVIAPTFRPDNIDNILASAGRQKSVDIQLVLLTHGFEVDNDRLTAQARRHGVDDLVVVHEPRSTPLGQCLNEMVARADGSVVSKMDDDDYYGPWYLYDLCRALDYSGAEVVGKAATYIYFESRNSTILTYSAHEHRYTDFVRGATLTARRETFLDHKFPALQRSEDSGFLQAVAAAGGLIYSSDRFNFVVNRLSDTNAHTWQSNDAALFSSGEVVFMGNAHDQVSL